MRFHLEQYELHHDKAMQAIKAGDYPSAREFLLVAARYLLESARDAEPALLKTRRETARKLQQQAAALPDCNVTPSSKEAANGRDEGLTEESQWLLAEKPNVHFSDVAGLNDVKEAIEMRVIQPLRHPDVARRFKKKAGGGALLYGPPGTGKTLIAKAIATELDAPFFNVKASNVMSPWVGVAEKNLAKLFDAARQHSLSVIFLDEAEALVGKRGSNSTVMNRVIPEFLAQVDGLNAESDNCLMLVGATNRPWDMDEAALRTGRFGEMFYVGLPDAEARLQILGSHLNGVPGVQALDLKEFAGRLDGYSGADIAGICLKATDSPFRRQIESGVPQTLTSDDLDFALQSAPPSVDQAHLRRYDTFRKTG